MARPQKQTVDYFPHYAGASNGKTLFILQSRFGNDGYATWFKLLELLATSEGHYFSYNSPSDWQFLLAKTGVSADILTEILTILADVEAIDRELNEHKVIWVQKFIDNLADLYKRRKTEFPRKPVVSTNNNPVSTNNNPQSKVKESKVDNKENTKRKYGEFQNVLLIDEEYQKLKDNLGAEVERFIETLSGYLESHKKRHYDSHYATILNWSRRDKEQGGKAKNSRDLPKIYAESPDYDDL